MDYCIYCNNKDYKKPIEIKSEIINKTVNYFRCNKCGSIHQYPLPEQKTLDKYYESYLNIKSKMNPGYLNENNMDILFKERDKTFNEIGFNKKLIKNKVNVELGCANGFFLKYLEHNGAKNIIGIDISKTMLDSIKIDKAKLYAGDLSKIKKRSVDILYLFNIIEHIPDQKKLMELILSRMDCSSYVIVEVPLAGLISRLFNKKWRFFMPDEHLHIPSKKALIALYKKNGFQLKGYTRFGSGFTSGTINKHLKLFFDYCAKFFRYGDRGVFLFYLDKD